MPMGAIVADDTTVTWSLRRTLTAWHLPAIKAIVVGGMVMDPTKNLEVWLLAAMGAIAVGAAAL